MITKAAYVFRRLAHSTAFLELNCNHRLNMPILEEQVSRVRKGIV